MVGGIKSAQRWNFHPTTNDKRTKLREGGGGLFASADFRSLEQSRPGTVTCRSFVYGGYCAGIEFSRLALNSRFSLAVSA